jgi:DNA transformation protein
MASSRRRLITGEELEQLPGIGPKTIAALHQVSIKTVADLRAIGAVSAYLRLKHADPQRITRNALWDLYGALNGIHWAEIPPEIKSQLLKEAGEASRSQNGSSMG